MQAKINASGTSLQGYVDASYLQLVDVFGEPHWRMGDKTTVEWAFETEDGIRFTIYDYKWASAKSDIVESFHVGGDDYRAVQTVQGLLDRIS